MKLTKNKELHIDLDFFKKRKHDLVFMVSGTLAAVSILWLFISSISFLVSHVAEALGVGGETANSVQFDMEGFNKLNISSQNSISPPPVPSASPLPTPTGTQAAPQP